MSSRQKVVMLVSDKAELAEPLKKLAGSDLLKGKEIHLLNIFVQEIYAYEFSPYVWPDPKLFEDLRSSVIKGLEKTADQLVTDAEDRKHVVTQCLLHHSPKVKMIDYLKEIGADTVVVVTRGVSGIKGLFTSSTAEHLMKFSPCDVYVMRAPESVTK
jgi:nucleotide-binding universal stress UspA family protein